MYTCEELELMIEEEINAGNKSFLLISDIINDLSVHLSEPITEKEIRTILFNGGSKYSYDIMGYIDGKVIGRILNHYHVKKIFSDKFKIFKNCSAEEFDSIVEFVEYYLNRKNRGKNANISI